MVYFDPPHMNNGSKEKEVGTSLKYGIFTTAEILNTVAESIPEFHRTLKPNTYMIFKWNDHSIKLPRLLPMFEKHFKAMFGSITSFINSRQTKTVWIMLSRIDAQTR